ncbi:hypothetical protein SAMN04488124_0862 [Halogeometricum limi]|uniref:Uncharacterized protein n=1 Tax=Halogeometricum limi TaxID=555875 RepID=A0A1I6G4S1_9EURY|nr:hypothetical protein SAMN04488124_0862 [Halogeometricum limi]
MREGLTNDVETVERAEELEEKIERTDELYGLTNGVRKIVEESVNS